MPTSFDIRLTLMGLVPQDGLGEIIHAIASSFAGLPHDPHAAFERGVNTIYANNLPERDVPDRVDTILTRLGVSYLWIITPRLGPVRSHSNIHIFDAETRTHLRGHVIADPDHYGIIVPLGTAAQREREIIARLPNIVEIDERLNGWHLEIVHSAHAALGQLRNSTLRPGLVSAHFDARALQAGASRET